MQSCYCNQRELYADKGKPFQRYAEVDDRLDMFCFVEDWRKGWLLSSITPAKAIEKYILDVKNGIQEKISVYSISVVATAVTIGDPTLLEKLVQELGHKILNTCDRAYTSPLLLACQYSENSPSAERQLCMGISKLMHMGANLNIPNSGGQTPLRYFAGHDDYVHLTKWLIQKGGKLPSCVAHVSDPSTQNLPLFRDRYQKVRANLAVAVKMIALDVFKLLSAIPISVVSHDVVRIITFLFWKITANRDLTYILYPLKSRKLGPLGPR